MRKQAETDDIYLLLSTSQFLVDFIEDKMPEGWIRHSLKRNLKEASKELTKLCDIPFTQDDIHVDEEVETQAYEASIFAENMMKVMMQVSYKLNKEDQLKFQMSFENLCTRFKVNLQ